MAKKPYITGSIERNLYGFNVYFILSFYRPNTGLIRSKGYLVDAIKLFFCKLNICSCANVREYLLRL